MGAVYPDGVKIVVRYPEANTTESTVKVIWREYKDDAGSDAGWTDGPILTLTEQDDWVNTASLQSLWPSTAYECESLCRGPVAQISISFIDRLSSLNKTILPYPSTPIRFRTFPDPRLATGSHFRFVVSSCITPNFPYMPLQSRRIKGFDLLARYLWPTREDTSSSTEAPSPAASVASVTGAVTPASTPAPPATEFMMFLGDFIYADVPYYFGDDKEAYRRLYRRNYASESFRKVYEYLRKCFR